MNSGPAIKGGPVHVRRSHGTASRCSSCHKQGTRNVRRARDRRALVVGRVVTHDIGRRRFYAAAERFAGEWGTAFDEAFGPASAGGAAA